VKKLSEISREFPFYLLAIGVFLIIVCHDLLANGMFLDGLIYSTVSKNLAHGIGTFWNPHFSATVLQSFHEHPPLAFGIQSIFFKIFGDSRFVERLYSLMTVFVSGIVLLKIWKTLGYRNGWITLFIWLTTATVFWTSYNNLLENTLTVFTSLSVLFYLKYEKNRKFYLLLLSGIVLTFGFLTKGFVAFFPWTLPFLLWLFLRHKTYGRMVIESAGLLIFTITPLLLLVLFFPVARISLLEYINHQVIDSIKHSITVDSRFDIIMRLFNELIPAIGLFLLCQLLRLVSKPPIVIGYDNIRKSLVFIFLGLTGVLPIMISMKQSGFYILPTYPFFSIGIAILLFTYIDDFIERIDFKSRGFLIFKWTACGVFIIGIFMSFWYSDGYSRDSEKIKDTFAILSVIPEGSIININPGMYGDWSLHAYFARFKNVSLDRDLNNSREYLLIKNEYYSDTLNSNYNIIKINTIGYELFKKNTRGKE
jgi:4-amino-4-deoxy-L-arabinose transferase-like glycosyltransferase